MIRSGISILLLLFVTNSYSQDYTNSGEAWRSSLYPENWFPGYSDSEGRFLHDFSYAGYHKGEEDIPVMNENVLDITQAPYNADNTGVDDVTIIIQQALDDVGTAGGGVVYLPAGIYRIKNSSTSSNEDAALHLKYDGVVLRGAGPDSSFIFHDESFLRKKDIINVRKAWSNWFDFYGTSSYLRMDLLGPTKVIPVQSVSGFSIGDLVIVLSVATKGFIEEHNMTGIWTEAAIKGVPFLRKIDSIDVERNLLIIDSPTRYPLKLRDYPRVNHAKEHIAECGIENLSIGNLENPKSGWDEESYITEGTGAYDVHFSHAIQFKYAQNCWVKNVHSFKPDVNTEDIHLLSNFLLMYMSRNITVDSCDFQKPQYEGGGGNGYMYTLAGNDCLVKNSRANHSRHNFDFKSTYSSGNVLLNCRGENSKYSSDFHMYLSMSNLIDGFVVNGDYLESTFRPYGGTAIHGYSSTQSVFYNTVGETYHINKNYIIESKQFGWGYVIGTSGAASNIRLDPISGTTNGYSYDTSPKDFAEGIGAGVNLVPTSLYLDQLEKRANRTKTLLKEYDVTIIIRDSSTLEYLSNCDIELYGITKSTDLSGAVTFENVPEVFMLNVTKSFYRAIEDEVVMIYSDTTLLFDLSVLRASIQFSLSEDGLSLENAYVKIGEDSIASNSLGISQFHNFLIWNDYAYTVRKEGYQSLSGSIYLESDTIIDLSLLSDAIGINVYNKEALKYWPNPVSNSLHLSFSERNSKRRIRIFDISGCLIWEQDSGKKHHRIDVADYVSGMYIFHVISEEVSTRHLFVKN